MRCREVTDLGYRVRRSSASMWPQQSGARAYTLVYTMASSPDLKASEAFWTFCYELEYTQRAHNLPEAATCLPYKKYSLFSHWSGKKNRERQPKNLAVVGIQTPPPCTPPYGSLRIISEYRKQVTSTCMFSAEVLVTGFSVVQDTDWKWKRIQRLTKDIICLPENQDGPKVIPMCLRQWKT